MQNTSTILKTSYPLQEQYADRLGGVIIDKPVPVGSVVTVSGRAYRVYANHTVTLTLFVSSNIVTISSGDYKIYGTAKIKRFANLIGIWSQTALITCLFRQAYINDNKAIKVLTFCSFTEENIFQTWTQS